MSGSSCRGSISCLSALILDRGRVGGEASLSQRCHFSYWFARVCKYLYINLCILLCHGGVFNVFVYSVYIKRKQNQSPLPCLQEIRPLNISQVWKVAFPASIAGSPTCSLPGCLPFPPEGDKRGVGTYPECFSPTSIWACFSRAPGPRVAGVTSCPVSLGLM